MCSQLRVATGWSTRAEPIAAVEEAWGQLLDGLEERPDFLLLQVSTGYEMAAVAGHLGRLAGGCPVHGSTSCRGVMTAEGLHEREGRGLGLYGLLDREGSFGVAGCELGDDARQQAAALVRQALERAGRPGEVPALVWITPTPGSEEEALAGITDAVGPSVQVVGGTSADNAYGGRWRQVGGGEVFCNGLVVSVLFPSYPTASCFHSGYLPTGHHGKVTRVEGRDLWEIDGEPAARVYGRWLDGPMAAAVGRGGAILEAGTYHPFGSEVQRLRGFSDYILSQPIYAHPDGRLTLNRDLREGEDLVLMTGSRAGMIERAGRVAASVLASDEQFSRGISGAFVTYCASCRLAVANDMEQVAAHLRQAFGAAPFLGAFSFGAQGCFSGAGHRHGNLMISIIVFGTGAAGG